MAPTESFTADYLTLTTGCGYVELQNWSTVTMTGADRHAFLHNTSTNNVGPLSQGEGCEAFCTDVKGKIVAHLFIFARQTQLDLLTVPRQAEPLIAHLDRYIIREDVQLQDRSSEVSWLLIAGADADAVLTNFGATTNQGVTVNLERPWQNRLMTFDGVECSVARCDLLRTAGYLLSCPSQEKRQVQQSLQASGARSCAAAAASTLRIESVWPLFGVDFSTANLPQEIDRDQQAINFNKGCYLGQETIARIDALGHVNQKIVLLQFAESDVLDAGPKPSLELSVAGKSVGQATSIGWSPQRQAPVGLALVRRGSNDVGAELESKCGAATVIAPG